MTTYHGFTTDEVMAIQYRIGGLTEEQLWSLRYSLSEKYEVAMMDRDLITAIKCNSAIDIIDSTNRL